MFIKSLGHRLGCPYTEYEVYLEKQQRIPSRFSMMEQMILQKLYAGCG